MRRPTDHAHLNLLELHRSVIRGTSNGKIIWQPRIQCWISDKIFSGESLPEPFQDLVFPEDLPVFYKMLSCSARIYEFNACFRKQEHPSVKFTERALSETEKAILIETPVGKQVKVYRTTPTSNRVITVKWEIESREELAVATWRAENTTWSWDQEKYDQLCARWGTLGLPTMYMPRITVQDLYLNTMGVERAIYALHDWPDDVSAYFRALNECHDRLIDVINASPIEIISFGDNVHCGTLSPKLFRRYVLPAYQERCAKLHTAGKFVHAHWDGDTKALLPFVRETGLDGIEAITPKPQGDVTLEEIKGALGEKMFLIDGLPAILFNATYPVSMLEEYTRKLISLFAPKLILGISDELSSIGEIERIRVVGRIVDDYNADCA